MSPLITAWGASLIVMLWALPMGIIRTLAYRSGEIDHTPTMRTAARFALGVGVVALACFVLFTVLLLA